MPKSDGKVIIDTLIDTNGFDKGVNAMKKQTSGLSKAVGKLGLAIGAAFAVGKLVQFGKEAIELGSDLQEVQNVVDVTFTTMSDKVDEFAKKATETAGLSETMAKRYTGTFGAMAKAFGFTEKESFDMSTSLTRLAGDAASFYNITQDEAYTKLKSVFTGETETLKDLGVVMTQNALDSYAMARGYGKTTKAMTEQEKVALRYSFVLDQLSAASGDFQRTSDGWANQMRIFRLNMDSIKANIGQALINVFTPLLKTINTVISKIAQLSSYFVAFSELLVGKSTSSGGGSPGEVSKELAGIQSGYEGIADATEAANKANKGYLSGLDEIRTFNNQDKGYATNIGSTIDIADSGSVSKQTSGVSEAIGVLSNKLKSIDFSNLIESFNQFKEALSPVTDLISDTLLWCYENVLLPVAEWTIEEGLPEALATVADLLDLIRIVAEKLSPLLDNIEKHTKKFGNKVTKTIESTIGSFRGFIKFLKGVFTGDWETALEGLKDYTEDIGDGIGVVMERNIPTSFKVMYQGTKSWMDSLGINGRDIFNKLKEDVSNSLINIASQSRDRWSDIYSNTSQFTSNIYDKVSSKYHDLKNRVSDKLSELFGSSYSNWGAIGSNSSEWASWIFGSVTGKYDNLRQRVSDIIGNLYGILHSNWGAIGSNSSQWSSWIYNAVTSSFESMKNRVRDIFSNLVNLLRNPINTVIGFINRMISGVADGINAIISSLNKIGFTVPSWLKYVPGASQFAGRHFGFNIGYVGTPQIPYLATGAVIPPNAPFMAMLGDQKHGRNLEMPENLLRQIVREESGNGNRGGNATYRFTGQINRRVLFDEFIEEAKLRQMQTGKNLLEFT